MEAILGFMVVRLTGGSRTTTDKTRMISITLGGGFIRHGDLSRPDAESRYLYYNCRLTAALAKIIWGEANHEA